MKITDEDVRCSWDAFAEIYTIQSGEAGDQYHRTFIIPSMLKLLGDIRGKRALDMACGTGIFSRYLARGGAHVTGIDLSPEMLSKAIEFEEKQPLGIAYYQGNTARMECFTDESFDAVTCNMGIMDIADFQGTISEANRVLVPGGQFVFSILHPCFCTPGSGWEKREPESKRDEDKLHWRVDHYFERQAGRGICPYALDLYFHRTLGDYINALIQREFIIQELDEPEPPPGRWLPMTRMAEFLVIGSTKPSEASH